MRGAVKVLAIEALSEGEKFVWEVVIWIRAKTGGNHLMKNGEVPETLEALVAVGLVERERKAVPPGRGPIPGELRWCYRLTPDGWKELWVVGDREQRWREGCRKVLASVGGGSGESGYGGGTGNAQNRRVRRVPDQVGSVTKQGGSARGSHGS